MNKKEIIVLWPRRAQESLFQRERDPDKGSPIPTLTKTEEKTEIFDAFTGLDDETSAQMWQMMSVQVEVQNLQQCSYTFTIFFSTEGIPLHAVYPAWPSGEQGGVTVGGGDSEYPGTEAVALVAVVHDRFKQMQQIVINCRQFQHHKREILEMKSQTNGRFGSKLWGSF